jgi:hypothetical protein
MVLMPVRCPYCQCDQIITGSQTETGQQRSLLAGAEAAPGPRR